MDTNATPPPVVCTLTLGKRAERALEWSDVANLAVATTQIDNGVVSTFPAHLLAGLADLVDRETQCCGTWLDSELSTQGDVVRLTLTTANADGLELIRSMAGLSA